MADTPMSEDPVLAALEFLVQVKDHKDKFGKDEWYKTNQPIAWECARRAISGA